MRTLEDIVYNAGEKALAEQERLVAGIRQRTGTLLAAHALVASLLGGTTLRDRGLSAPAWIALTALVAGLVIAAILLAPWSLRFAMGARKLYDDLYQQASTEAPDGNPRLAGGSGLHLREPARTQHRERAPDVLAVGRAGRTDDLPDARLAGGPGGRLKPWSRNPSHRT